MKLPGRRLFHLIAFLCCAGLLGYAYYAQFVQGYEPCPLCIFQRVALIGLGLVFLLGAIFAPRGPGRWLTGLLFLVTGGAGIAVAGRHLWLQHLPADRVPACGPGLDYMLDVFPLADVVRMAFTGSGECANIDWSFLGLSMPAWVLLWFVLLTGAGVWNTFRSGSD